MHKLEEKLNYKFNNQTLLKEAFMHPSYQNKDKIFEDTIQFEQLEFLGDRVLGLCIANLVTINGKNNTIKHSAQMHANLVSTNSLAKIGLELELDKYLIHSIQTISAKVLADTTESLFGAIFLDSNYATIYKIISKLFNKLLDIKIQEPKMQLQEFAQSKRLDIPKYEVIHTEGNEHNKNYIVEVILIQNDNIFMKATGSGKSKHAASKQAAKHMLEKLNLK